MRKITSKSANVFLARGNMSKQNMIIETIQEPHTTTTKMYLHGNEIARIEGRHENAKMYICDGGYQSNTTKERLNGLPGVRVNQKDWQWYLNGEKWDGEFTLIDNINLY